MLTIVYLFEKAGGAEADAARFAVPPHPGDFALRTALNARYIGMFYSRSRVVYNLQRKNVKSGYRLCLSEKVIQLVLRKTYA